MRLFGSLKYISNVLTQKASTAQFYKRNSRWVEGLVSAAKAVGSGVSLLVDTSDRALNNEAKLGKWICFPLRVISLSHSGATFLEEIMVCGQEIAASTAQLVSASRVKAKFDSPGKQQLETDSKQGRFQVAQLFDTRQETLIFCYFQSKKRPNL